MTVLKHIYQKGVSALMIPLLLASYVVIPSSTHAQEQEHLDIVALLVDKDMVQSSVQFEDTVDGGKLTMKQRVERYATDIQAHLDKTKVLIVPVASNESVPRVQEALQSLYVLGDGTPGQDTSLAGVVLIGDVPLPLVNKGDASFISLFPYTDFDDPSYVYDSTKDEYVYVGSRNKEQAEIWHGVIPYPLRFSQYISEDGRQDALSKALKDQGEGAYNGLLLQYKNSFLEEQGNMLAFYFDKNHSFYTGGEYSSFSHQAIYADLFRETEQVSSVDVKGYETYVNEWENKSYMRYTKEWLSKLQKGFVAGTTLGQEDYGQDANGKPRTREEYVQFLKDEVNANTLLSPDAKKQELSRIDDLSAAQQATLTATVPQNIPDIFTRDAIEGILETALEVFEGKSIQVAQYFANTGRWDYSGSSGDYEGQSIYKIISVLDELSRKRIKAVNDAAEKHVDTMLTQAAEESYNLQLDIPITPVNYFGRYTGYLYEKPAWDSTDVGGFFNKLGDLWNGITLQNDWQEGKPPYFDLTPYPSEQILRDGAKYKETVDAMDFLQTVDDDKKYIPYTQQEYTKIVHHKLTNDVIKQAFPDNCDTNITDVLSGSSGKCYTWYDNPTPAQEFYIEYFDPTTDDTLSDGDKLLIKQYQALRKMVDLLNAAGADNLAAVEDQLTEEEKQQLQSMVDAGIFHNAVGNFLTTATLQGQLGVIEWMHPWLVQQAVILHVVDLPFTAEQCSIYLGGGPEDITYGNSSIPLYLKGFDQSSSGGSLWNSSYQEDKVGTAWREEKVDAQVTLALAPLEREKKRIQDRIAELGQSDADHTETIKALNQQLKELEQEITKQRTTQKEYFDQYYSVRDRDEGRFGAYLDFVQRIAKTADNSKLVEANRLYDKSPDSLLVTKDDGNQYLDPATLLDPTWFGYDENYASGRPTSFTFPDFYDLRRHGFLGGCSVNNTTRVNDTANQPEYTHPLRIRLQQELNDLTAMQIGFIEDTTVDFGRFLRFTVAPLAFVEMGSLQVNIQSYIFGVWGKVAEMNQTLLDLLFDPEFINSNISDQDALGKTVLSFQQQYAQHKDLYGDAIGDKEALQQQTKELLLTAMKKSIEIEDLYQQEQERTEEERLKNHKTVTLQPSDFGVAGDPLVIAVYTGEGKDEALNQVTSLMLTAYDQLRAKLISTDGEIDTGKLERGNEMMRSLLRLAIGAKRILEGETKSITLRRDKEDLIEFNGLTCDPSRALMPIFDIAGSISPKVEQYIPLRTVRQPVEIKEGNVMPSYGDTQTKWETPTSDQPSQFKTDVPKKRDAQLPSSEDVTSGSIYNKDPSGRINYDVVPSGDVGEYAYNAHVPRLGETSYKACLRYATLGAQQTKQQSYELQAGDKNDLNKAFQELADAQKNDIPQDQFISSALADNSSFPWMKTFLSLTNPLMAFGLISDLSQQNIDQMQIYLRKEFPPFGADTNDPMKRRDLYSLYGVRRIISVIPHKEPTNDTIARQVSSGTAESLPVDNPRYVDFYHYEPIPVYSKYGEVLDWKEYEEHIQIPYLNFFQLLPQDQTFVTPKRTDKSAYEEDMKGIQNKITDLVTGFNNYLVDYVAKTGLSTPDEKNPEGNDTKLAQVSFTQQAFDNVLVDSNIASDTGNNKADEARRRLAFSVYWQKLTLAQKYQFVIDNYMTSNPDDELIEKGFFDGGVGYESGTVIIKGNDAQSGSASLSNLVSSGDAGLGSSPMQGVDDPAYINQEQQCDTTYRSLGGTKFGVPIEHWGEAISCWVKNLATPVSNDATNEHRFTQWMNRADHSVNSSLDSVTNFGTNIQNWWNDSGEFVGEAAQLVTAGTATAITEATHFLNDVDGDGLSTNVAPLDTAPFNADAIGGSNGGGNGIPDGDDVVASVLLQSTSGSSGGGYVGVLPLGGVTPLEVKAILQDGGKLPLVGNNYSYLNATITDGADHAFIPDSEKQQRVSDGQITLHVFPKDTAGDVTLRVSLVRRGGGDPVVVEGKLKITSEALYGSYYHIPCTQEERDNASCARPDILDPEEGITFLSDEAVHSLTIIAGTQESGNLEPLQRNGKVKVEYYKDQIDDQSKYKDFYVHGEPKTVNLVDGVWSGVLPLPRESGTYYVRLVPEEGLGLAPLVTSFTVVHSSYQEYSLSLEKNVVTVGSDVDLGVLFKDAEGNLISKGLVEATLQLPKGVSLQSTSQTQGLQSTSTSDGTQVRFHIGEVSSFPLHVEDLPRGQDVKSYEILLTDASGGGDVHNVSHKSIMLYVYPKGSVSADAHFTNGETSTAVPAITPGEVCSKQASDPSRAVELQVALRDTAGKDVPYTGALQVSADDKSLFVDLPGEISIVNGQGSIVLYPGRIAGGTKIYVSDPDGIIGSSFVDVQVKPGSPVAVHFASKDISLQGGLTLSEQAFDAVRVEAYDSCGNVAPMEGLYAAIETTPSKGVSIEPVQTPVQTGTMIPVDIDGTTMQAISLSQGVGLFVVKAGDYKGDVQLRLLPMVGGSGSLEPAPIDGDTLHLSVDFVMDKNTVSDLSPNILYTNLLGGAYGDLTQPEPLGMEWLLHGKAEAVTTSTVGDSYLPALLKVLPGGRFQMGDIGKAGSVQNIELRVSSKDQEPLTVSVIDSGTGQSLMRVRYHIEPFAKDAIHEQYNGGLDEQSMSTQGDGIYVYASDSVTVTKEKLSTNGRTILRFAVGGEDEAILSDTLQLFDRNNSQVHFTLNAERSDVLDLSLVEANGAALARVLVKLPPKPVLQTNRPLSFDGEEVALQFIQNNLVAQNGSYTLDQQQQDLASQVGQLLGTSSNMKGFVFDVATTLHALLAQAQGVYVLPSDNSILRFVPTGDQAGIYMGETKLWLLGDLSSQKEPFTMGSKVVSGVLEPSARLDNNEILSFHPVWRAHNIEYVSAFPDGTKVHFEGDALVVSNASSGCTLENKPELLFMIKEGTDVISCDDVSITTSYDELSQRIIYTATRGGTILGELRVAVASEDMRIRNGDTYQDGLKGSYLTLSQGYTLVGDHIEKDGNTVVSLSGGTLSSTDEVQWKYVQGDHDFELRTREGNNLVAKARLVLWDKQLPYEFSAEAKDMASLSDGIVVESRDRNVVLSENDNHIVGSLSGGGKLFTLDLGTLQMSDVSSAYTYAYTYLDDRGYSVDIHKDSTLLARVHVRVPEGGTPFLSQIDNVTPTQPGIYVQEAHHIVTAEKTSDTAISIHLGSVISCNIDYPGHLQDGSSCTEESLKGDASLAWRTIAYNGIPLAKVYYSLSKMKEKSDLRITHEYKAQLYTTSDSMGIFAPFKIIDLEHLGDSMASLQSMLTSTIMDVVGGNDTLAFDLRAYNKDDNSEYISGGELQLASRDLSQGTFTLKQGVAVAGTLAPNNTCEDRTYFGDTLTLCVQDNHLNIRNGQNDVLGLSTNGSYELKDTGYSLIKSFNVTDHTLEYSLAKQGQTTHELLHIADISLEGLSTFIGNPELGNGYVARGIYVAGDGVQLQDNAIAQCDQNDCQTIATLQNGFPVASQGYVFSEQSTAGPAQLTEFIMQSSVDGHEVARMRVIPYALPLQYDGQDAEIQVTAQDGVSTNYDKGVLTLAKDGSTFELQLEDKFDVINTNGTWMRLKDMTAQGLALEIYPDGKTDSLATITLQLHQATLAQLLDITFHPGDALLNSVEKDGILHVLFGYDSVLDVDATGKVSKMGQLGSSMEERSIDLGDHTLLRYVYDGAVLLEREVTNQDYVGDALRRVTTVAKSAFDHAVYEGGALHSVSISGQDYDFYPSRFAKQDVSYANGTEDAFHIENPFTSYIYLPQISTPSTSQGGGDGNVLNADAKQEEIFTLLSGHGIYVETSTLPAGVRVGSTSYGSSSNNSGALALYDDLTDLVAISGNGRVGVESALGNEGNGVGYTGEYDNMLLFAGGNNVGESSMHNMTAATITLGDPVISLPKKPLDEGEHFSNDVGNLVYSSDTGNITSVRFYDVDKDGKEDIVFSDGGSSIKYVKNLGGRPARWKYMGPIVGVSSEVTGLFVGSSANDDSLYFSQRSDKNSVQELSRSSDDHYVMCPGIPGTDKVKDMVVGDVDGDGTGDIALINNAGEIRTIIVDRSKDCTDASRYDNQKVDSLGVKLAGSTDVNGTAMSLYDTFIRFNDGDNSTDASRNTPVLSLADAPRSFPANPDIVFVNEESTVQVEGTQTPEEKALYDSISGLANILPVDAVSISPVKKVVAKMLVAADLPYVKSGGSATVRFMEGLAALRKDNPYAIVPTYVPGGEIINGLAERFAPLLDIVGSVTSQKAQRLAQEEQQYQGNVGLYTEKTAKDLNGGHVEVGDTLAYTIKVHNTLSENKNIDIADALPDSVELESVHCTIDDAAYDCTNDTAQGGDIFGLYLGNISLQSGQTLSIEYTVHVNKDLYPLKLNLIATSFLKEAVALFKVTSQVTKLSGKTTDVSTTIPNPFSPQSETKEGQKSIAVAVNGQEDLGLLTYTKDAKSGDFLFDIISGPEQKPVVLDIPVISDFFATFNINFEIGGVKIGKKSTADADLTTLADQQKKMSDLLKQSFLTTDKDKDGLIDLWDDDLSGAETLPSGGTTGGSTSTASSFSSTVDSIHKFLQDNQCNLGGYCPVPNEWNYAIGAPGEGAISAIPANFDIPILATPTPSTVIPVWPPDITYFTGGKDVSQFRLYLTPTLTGRFAMSACTGPYSLGTFGGVGSTVSSIGSQAGLGVTSGGIPNCMSFLLPDFLDIKSLCKDLAHAAMFGGQGLMQMVATGGYTATRAVRSKEVTAIGGQEVRGTLGSSQLEFSSEKLQQYKGQWTEGFQDFFAGTADIIHKMASANQGRNLPASARIKGAFPGFLMDWLELQLTEYINKKLTLPTIRLLLPDVTTGVLSPVRGDLTLAERFANAKNALSGGDSIAARQKVQDMKSNVDQLTTECAGYSSESKSSCTLSTDEAVGVLRDSSVNALQGASDNTVLDTSHSLAGELETTISSLPDDQKSTVQALVTQLRSVQSKDAALGLISKGLETKYQQTSSTQNDALQTQIDALKVKVYEAKVAQRGETLAQVCKGDAIACSIRDLQYSFDNAVQDNTHGGTSLADATGVIGKGLNVKDSLQREVGGVDEVLQLIAQTPFVDVRTKDVVFDYPWIPPERISEYTFRLEGAYNDSVKNFHGFYSQWKDCFVDENLDVASGEMKPKFTLKESIRNGIKSNSSVANDPVLNEGVSTQLYVQCVVAAKVGEEAWAGIKGISQNIQRLKEYSTFYTKIGKYLSWRKYVIGQVTLTVSDIISQLSKYVQDQRQILVGWKNAVRSVKRYAENLQGFIDIFENYQRRCAKCQAPDRGTKYASTLEMLRFLLPLEVIPVTGWPDVEIDLTDISLRLILTIPNLRLRPYEVQLPQVSPITLPKLQTLTPLQLQRYNKLGLNLAMPILPALPQIPALPDVPKLELPRFPDLPPPPVIGNLNPRIRVIITSTAKILEIICLLNRNIFPVPESGLRSHIEKLTASRVTLTGNNNINNIPAQPSIAKIRVATHARLYYNITQLSDVLVGVSGDWNGWIRRNLGSGSLLKVLSQINQDIAKDPNGRSVIKFLNDYSLTSMIQGLNTVIAQGRKDLQNQLQNQTALGINLPPKVLNDIRTGYAEKQKQQQEIDTLLQQLEQGQVSQGPGADSETLGILSAVVPQLVSFQEAFLDKGTQGGDQDIASILEEQIQFLEDQKGYLADDVRLPAIDNLKRMQEQYAHEETSSEVNTTQYTAPWEQFRNQLQTLEHNYTEHIADVDTLRDSSSLDELKSTLLGMGLLAEGADQKVVADASMESGNVDEQLKAAFDSSVQLLPTGLGEGTQRFSVKDETKSKDIALKDYGVPYAMADTTKQTPSLVTPVAAAIQTPTIASSTGTSTTTSSTNQEETKDGAVLIETPEGNTEVLTNYAYDGEVHYDIAKEQQDVVYSMGGDILIKYNGGNSGAVDVYNGGDKVRTKNMDDIKRSPRVYQIWMDRVTNHGVSLNFLPPSDRPLGEQPTEPYMYVLNAYTSASDAMYQRNSLEYYLHVVTASEAKSAEENMDLIRSHWSDAGYSLEDDTFSTQAETRGLPGAKVLIASNNGESISVDIPVSKSGQLYITVTPILPSTSLMGLRSQIVFGQVQPGLDKDTPQIISNQGNTISVALGSDTTLTGVVKDASQLTSIHIDTNEFVDSNHDGDYTNDPDVTCDDNCQLVESSKTGRTYALPETVMHFDTEGIHHYFISAQDEYGNTATQQLDVKALQVDVFIDGYNESTGLINGHVYPPVSGLQLELYRERNKNIQELVMPQSIITDDDGKFEVRGVGK